MDGGNSAGRPEPAAGAPAEAPAEAPAKRRPGRPRMKDSLPADPNDNSRRVRMRLAQRSYRSRKETELAVTRARADILQRALTSSLDEFIKFHETLSDKAGDLPSGFVLQQLNKTATNIMTIARSAQVDEWPRAGRAVRLLDTMDDGEDDGNDDNDNTISILTQEAAAKGSSALARPKPTTISQRLVHACFDRAAHVLNLASSPVLCLLPAMLLPVQFERREIILSRPKRYLSAKDCEPVFNREEGLLTARQLPKMLRMIEGQSSSLVPRIPPPNLQRLQFGRTRTVLTTAFPDLQGEWLEASDVEEYLEQRGIFIRHDSPDTDVLNLAIPVGSGLSAQISDLNQANFHNPVCLLANPPSLVDPSLVTPLEFPADPPGGFSETPDFNIFGEQRDAQVLPPGMAMFSPTSWAVDNTDILPAGMAMRGPDHINIMISLDKLILRLAAKAVCLGPFPGIRRANVDEAIRDAVVRMPQQL
ncbi:hypothetical protein Trco_007094 [Trichoderma cornu-damae]|uniref:BZIP domain-containing protein n=1 Tax=Trichoderma cornu-damae TaxID=654480 RepID=A0A9P8QMU4_9HYPO|nr:hypothetical protein Trco_007094 [Trichoderma cornu-damae]